MKLEESKYVVAGDKVHVPLNTPIGNLALGICYDLRFPQFSTTQRLKGAHVLTYPRWVLLCRGQTAPGVVLFGACSRCGSTLVINTISLL